MTVCTSGFKAWLSQLGHQWEDVSALNVSYVCKVWVALVCIKHTLPSGQADIDTQPKQAHYQKINCTEFACENMYMSKQQCQFAYSLPVYKHTLLTGPLIIKPSGATAQGSTVITVAEVPAPPHLTEGKLVCCQKVESLCILKLCIFKKKGRLPSWKIVCAST